MHCCICNVIVIVKICNFDTFVSLYVRQCPGPVQSMCDTEQPVAAFLSLLSLKQYDRLYSEQGDFHSVIIIILLIMKQLLHFVWNGHFLLTADVYDVMRNICFSCLINYQSYGPSVLQLPDSPSRRQDLVLSGS